MLVLIFYSFLFLVSKVNVAMGEESSLIEDELMTAFAKGSVSEFYAKHNLSFDSINHLLEQKYFGVLYFLRKNWQCEKVTDKIKKENIEQIKATKDYYSIDLSKICEDCEKYRKHMIILYEYLFMEYAGDYVKDNHPNLAEQIPDVEKPNFELFQTGIRKKKGTIVDVIKTLSFIWRSFFDESYRSTRHTIRSFWYSEYYACDKTNLLEEYQLIKNYEVNFNNEYQRQYLFKPDELNLDGESKFDNLYVPIRSKFDETMEEYMKKAKDNAKDKKTASTGLIEYILETPFYDIETAMNNELLFIEDEAMAAVAKGSFSEFCTKYNLNFDSINHLLVQKYEIYLGILHMLQENWKCEKVIDKIKKELKEETERISSEWTNPYFYMSYVWEDCEKCREHMFILHEYLFMEYAGAFVKDNHPNLAKQIPAMEKPIFELIRKDKKQGESDILRKGTLLDAIKALSFIWKSFFDESYRNSSESFWYYEYYNCHKINLLNERQYEINSNQPFRRKYLFKPEDMNLNVQSKFDNLYEPVRSKFDETMKKHLKQAKKNSGNKNSHSVIEYIENAEFYGLDTAIEDNAFLTIITNQINFEKFGNKFANILMTKFLKPNSLNKLNLEESKKYLAQKYEAFHVVMYLMSEKWQCEKIVSEQGKCEHFRKYLKILFDYLLRVYEEAECLPMARKFPTVRPIFQFGDGKKIESLINVVDRLSEIATFFFDSKYAKEYQTNVEESLKNAPNLINANDLKYDKSPGKKIIELIIGKSPKREKGKGESSTDSKESSYRLIQEFKNNLDHMSITAKRTISEKRLVEEEVKWGWLFSSIKELKLDDQLFLTFIKDQEKFEGFCKLEGEELLKNIGLLSKRKGKGIYDIGETVEYLKKQYEGYLGVLYLFKEKWKCDGITEKQKRDKCEKFKKYIVILYEYLLKVFVEAKNWPMAQYFSTSIPNFHLGKEAQTAILIDVLDSLIQIWAFFFVSTYHIQFEYKLEKMFEKFPNYELKLLNEQEFEQFEKNGQKIMKNLKDIKIFGSQSQTKNLKKGKKNEISEGLLPTGEENAEEKAISALRKEFNGMMKEKAEKVVKIIYSEEEGLGKMKKVLQWLVK